MLHKQYLALAAESLLMIVSVGAAAPQTATTDRLIFESGLG